MLSLGTGSQLRRLFLAVFRLLPCGVRGELGDSGNLDRVGREYSLDWFVLLAKNHRARAADDLRGRGGGLPDNVRQDR